MNTDWLAWVSWVSWVVLLAAFVAMAVNVVAIRRAGRAQQRAEAEFARYRQLNGELAAFLRTAAGRCNPADSVALQVVPLDLPPNHEATS